MGYQPAVVVVPSAARTTSGNANSTAPAGMHGDSTKKLAILVDVTAASASDTLDISVEWSHDGTAFAPGQPADSFTQITVAGKAAKSFDIKGEFFRIVWTIGGTTPSFTFSVSTYGV